MESSDCGGLLAVTGLMELAILILSAYEKYFQCLIELERTVVNNWGPRTDPWGTPENTSKGVE
jgi:hypothetical protein